jgi:hypothetical protein
VTARSVAADSSTPTTPGTAPGGALGREPDWQAILDAHDVLPQHESEALGALDDHLHLLRTFGVRIRAERASWN